MLYFNFFRRISCRLLFTNNSYFLFILFTFTYILVLLNRIIIFLNYRNRILSTFKNFYRNILRNKLLHNLIFYHTLWFFWLNLFFFFIRFTIIIYFLYIFDVLGLFIIICLKIYFMQMQWAKVDLLFVWILHLDIQI